MNIHKEQKSKKYEADILLIKDLLKKVDEVFLVDYWAFYVWGGFLLLASFLHYYLGVYKGFSLLSLLLQVWLPSILISSFLETVAWITKSEKDSFPVFSKTNIRLFWGIIMSCAAIAFVLVVLYQKNYVENFAVITLALFIMPMLIYGQIVHYLNIHALFLIIASIIIYNFELTIHAQFFWCGIVLGVSMIVSGVIAQKKEKKINE
jgi:hypothetical protein